MFSEIFFESKKLHLNCSCFLSGLTALAKLTDTVFPTHCKVNLRLNYHLRLLRPKVTPTFNN